MTKSDDDASLAESVAVRPISVLLVDDQPFVGAAVNQLLATEADIELHCCYQAADAIAQANQLRPAVIFQDLVMPDVDGMTMVESFRQNPNTAHTPIVVLSGNDDASSRTRALASGADDYLVKLPTKAALIARIRHHAGKGRAAQGSTQDSAGVKPEEMIDETLDWSVLEQFGPFGPSGFARTLIDQFLQEATLRFSSLERAAQCLDMSELRAQAHSLKGSAGVIGARRLAALCTHLEAHVDRGLADDAALTFVAAIDRELMALRGALSEQKILTESRHLAPEQVSERKPGVR